MALKNKKIRLFLKNSIINIKNTIELLLKRYIIAPVTPLIFTRFGIQFIKNRYFRTVLNYLNISINFITIRTA